MSEIRDSTTSQFTEVKNDNPRTVPFTSVLTVILGLLVTSISCVWLSPSASAQQVNQFRVTVIAVTEFEDNQLANSALIDSIKDTTKKLEDFFTIEFGIVPRVLRTRSETTAEAIRKWLFYDLSRDSSQSIHLVFVLTHGIGYQYAGSTIFKNELFLASSDTKSDDYFGVAIRGSELIDAFQRLSKGSSVFLFLDTCGSGSLDNSGISRLLEADRLAATRMMILAASMSEQSAFRGRFTRTLLQIWQSHKLTPAECHSGEKDIPDYVTKKMNAVDPLDSKFTQNVSLISSYATDFCIESFASGTSLVLLGNPTDEELKLVVRLNKDEQDTIPLRVKAGAVEPLVLRRETYTVDVEAAFPTSSIHPNNIPLDLTTDFVQYQSLYSSDPVENALVKQKAAEYAEVLGAPPAKVSALVGSAATELHSALTIAQTQAARITKTVQSQRAILEQAKFSKLAAEQTAADAKTQLSQKENQISNNLALPGGVASIVSHASMVSPQEIQELNSTRSHADQTKAKAIVASQQVEDEARHLSSVETTQAAVKAKLDQIDRIVESFSVSAGHAAARKNARASLLISLSALFPTHEASRGLVVSLPPSTTPEQIQSLGKLIASAGPDLLVEAEVQVAGSENYQNQEEATRLADLLQKELQHNTGLPPERTVARGLPAMNLGTTVVQSIVISGDPIEKQ